MYPQITQTGRVPIVGWDSASKLIVGKVHNPDGVQIKESRGQVAREIIVSQVKEVQAGEILKHVWHIPRKAVVCKEDIACC